MHKGEFHRGSYVQSFIALTLLKVQSSLVSSCLVFLFFVHILLLHIFRQADPQWATPGLDMNVSFSSVTLIMSYFKASTF